MFRSIRWSLLFWYSLILLFVTGGFGGAIYYQQSRARKISLDGDLASSVQVLAARARLVPGPGVNPPPPPDRTRGERPPNSPDRGKVVGGVGLPDAVLQHYEGEDRQRRYFVIWRRDGSVARASEAAPDVPYPGPTPGPGETPGVRFRDRGPMREAVLAGPPGVQCLVGRSTAGDRQELRQLMGILTAIGAGVLAVGLLAGWLLANRIVRPIATIERAAAEISETSLAQRINVSETQSELGGLARVLNSMFERLEAAFERQTRFAADASHELRTPLSVIHTEAQSALSQPRSAEDYCAALETCLRAAKRMRPLVDSLLVLARADAGRLELKPESFDLAATAQDCAALVEPLAAEREVSIDLNLQPTTITADSFRITQVIANLLTNAILYNRKGGHVTLTIRPEGAEAVITVADTGMGIPADHLSRVFDRFHRLDASRSRESGGAGLGLAICKGIVEAHRGTITVISEVDRGTTFTVRLPGAAQPMG